MGFNPTFYAGRPKLSEVTIDSDLNMGGRNISSVDTIGVNLIRAGRVDSPYRPDPWPTEELEWGDVAPHEQALPSGGTRRYDSPPFTALTATRGEYVTIRITNSGTDPLTVCTVLINGTSVYAHGRLNRGAVAEYTGFVNAGDVVSIDARTESSQWVTTLSVLGIFSGVLGGQKTFNLTGKWLALGIDMKGLAATVKIQGVEIPYSDYAKYFPLAPTELKFPGGWDASQVRPVVEVYV